MRTLLLLTMLCASLSGPVALAQTTCTTNLDCADGNACNGTELCRSGVCGPGTPAPNGQGCNTGNPCSNNDTCQGGVCTAGVLRPDGSGCSDGNQCDGRETCQAGRCTPGPAPANGTRCGDADPCNGGDTCQAGVCQHSPAPPEGAACSDGFICNGLETCRGGVCTAGQRAPDGASCSDGKLCNGAEVCQAGICRTAGPLNCDDGDACTTDSCDNAAGGCKHTPKAEGASCNDGNFCNGRETCVSGKCTKDTRPLPQLCDDGNSCNGIDFCLNEQCIPGTPLPDGTSCADSDVCNGLERCRNGACRRGEPLACDDTNPCAVGSCHPQNGCQFTLAPNGTPCPDSNVCDGASTCQQGGCLQGSAPSCGALACDPVAGCVVDRTITGEKLLLRTRRGRASLKAQTREPVMTSVPPSAGTATDPVLHGGSVRVRSLSGGFDAGFALPAENWRYLGDPAENRGFRYRGRGGEGDIRSVVVKDGKLAKVAGRGLDIPAALLADPDPVEVTLVLGNQRYCMRFGGTTQFEAERRFSAHDAPAPGTCP